MRGSIPATVLLTMLATATLADAPTEALAEATDHPLSMWRLDGVSNRVYLLGSVHLLREQDYPLPSTIYVAYDDADILVMELDMDDLDPVETQALVRELGLIAEGGTLEALMGTELYAQAQKFAADANIPLDMLASSEPWLAAITIEQLVLQRVGFNPEFGIEAHLADRAGMDDKEILGLERLEEQLGLLDSLSIDAQRALLIQTLSEAIEIGPMMDELIAAWRRGDVSYLETNMLADMRRYPELYEALVVTRNRDWTEQIEGLLDDDRDYLIVVGALHLVGEDSVPALLERSGRDVTQMQQGE